MDSIIGNYVKLAVYPEFHIVLAGDAEGKLVVLSQELVDDALVPIWSETLRVMHTSAWTVRFPLFGQKATTPAAGIAYDEVTLRKYALPFTQKEIIRCAFEPKRKLWIVQDKKPQGGSKSGHTGSETD